VAPCLCGPRWWASKTQQWRNDTDREKPKDSGQKAVPEPLCLPEIRHGMPWARTGGAAQKSSPYRTVRELRVAVPRTSTANQGIFLEVRGRNFELISACIPSVLTEVYVLFRRPSRRMLRYYLNLGYGRFLPRPSRFIVYSSSCHSTSHNVRYWSHCCVFYRRSMKSVHFVKYVVIS
jgi:hypothetical protein